MRRYTVRRRWILGLTCLSALASAILLGRGFGLSDVEAKPPVAGPAPAAAVEAHAAPLGSGSSDYSKRVVAYIYGTVPITREDLGEYLIARLGVDRLNTLVNKRIIEHACQKKGIEVTAAEVEASLEEDLRGLNVNRKDFVDRVLKQYKKTLYEWREDVIKPRLLLTKLCRDRVQVTDEDLAKAFEAYYGEKIEARIILWAKGEDSIAMRAYEKIRDNDEEFDRAARTQASSTLASSGGRISPIGRHTTGNPELEKLAFSLQPGELSHVLGTKEGPVVMKCIKRVPADKTKTLPDVRATLEKEVFDKKVQAEIPIVMQELRDQASPKTFLKAVNSDEDMLRDIREELGSEANRIDSGVGATVATPSAGKK